jgi:hypothetical protein
MANPNLNDLREESVGILSTLNDISKLIAQNADKLSKATGDSAATFRESFSASTRLANELLKLDEETLANAKERANLDKQFRSVNKEINSLTAKRNTFLKQANLATGANQNLLKGIAQLYQDGINSLQEQVAETDKLARKFVDIEKNLGLTGKILEGINKIPLLNKFIDINKALQAANEEAATLTGDRWSVLGKALGSLGKDIKKNLTDPLVYVGIAVSAFKKLVELGFSFSQRTADIARNMGITTQQAREYNNALYTSFKLSQEQAASVKAFAEANQNINDYLGTSVVFSEQILSTQTALVKRAGLTNEEAARLAELSFITGKTQEDIYDTIGAQNKGILNNRKVLAQVLKVSGQLAAQYKNNPILLAQAVTQANKLGLTLEQTQNIAKGLLNFEDSISAELEAELLTGKDLNLEKARYLALQGKSAEAAEEIAKQVGSAEEFSRMNVIQQESLAKAAGMSADELANSLVKREAISKLQSEEFKRTGIMLTSEQAATKLKDQQLSASEKLTASTQALKDSLASIIAGPLGTMVDMVTNLFNKISQSDLAKSVLGYVGGIGAAIAAVGSAILLGKGVINAFKGRPSGRANDPIFTMNEGGSGFGGGSTGGGRYRDPKTGRFAKAPTPKGGSLSRGLGRMGKGLLKGGGKGLTRLIPGAGALLGAGLEFAEGGFTLESAGRAALSGGLGFLGGAAGTALLPGAGTVGGAVGGSLLGDYLGDAIFGEREEPPAEDFIYRPGQKAMKFRKDDVVVGGTNLGGGGNNTEVIALLKELVAAVKSGGDVYLDGTKVGTAMAMGTYKTQ